MKENTPQGVRSPVVVILTGNLALAAGLLSILMVQTTMERAKRYDHGPMEDLDLPLWEQQVGETTKAHDAFKAYLQLGEDRTLEAVRKMLGKSATYIERLSAQWHWLNRVAAWNRMQQRLSDAAIAKENEKHAKTWAERENRRREKYFELGEQLIEQARQMLKFPLAQQTKTTTEEREEGGRIVAYHTTIIIEPVNCNPIANIQLGTRLQDLSLGIVQGKDEPTPVATEQVAQPARVVIVLPDNGRGHLNRPAIDVQSTPKPPMALASGSETGDKAPNGVHVASEQAGTSQGQPEP
jgi:hypothetical protein